MSDHYVCFLPVDPACVPSESAQAAAVALLRAAWPDAREITPETAEHIVFRDCGENFESVACPHCGTELEVESWQGSMDRDYSEEGGFRLDAQSMACCGQRSTLNDLKYTWPQGFSRFALRAADPGGEVPARLLAELESSLGCRLRVIHQMY